MDSTADYLDSMLIPLSLLLMLGYHAYLWHHLNLNPRLTTIGVHSIRRRQWLLQLQRGDDKKAMLAIQSLRNTLMTTIFTATVTILLTLALAALANNAYNAGPQVLTSPIFGIQTGRMMGLKYGSASVMLLGSFLCSSVATGLLIDSNFLVLNGWDWTGAREAHVPTEKMLERGYGMALVGNRMLCVGLATSLWLLGPAPVAVASLALVWGLYNLDFPVPTNLAISC
ncbi:hypothetical protein V2J09_009610 [Rumex salicifolius]